MEHVGNRRILATLFCTALILPSLSYARISTQADINDIADNLGITVEVKANHVPDGNYTIAFILANRRPSGPRLLDTDDWLITFCLNDAGILTKPEFFVKNISIKALSDNFYTISPTGFIGLGPKNAFKITIQAYGLSAFRYDFQPGFIISSPKTSAQTIKSTTDTNLRFVKLVETNDEMDPTKPTLNQLDRFIGYQFVEDLHRVPESLIIPRPEVCYMQPPFDILINLTDTQKFYFQISPTVSTAFKNIFKDMFSKIDGVSLAKMAWDIPFRNQRDGDIVTLEITGDRTKHKTYYEIDIEARFYHGQHNKIHLSAATEEGLHYAMESFKGIIGIYGILPHKVVLQDQGRFDFRSVTLDLTKHMFDKPTLYKFLDLMSMYKLNKLILNLADDFGWRLQIPGFDELTTVGGKRCMDQTKCLPPFFDAGAQGTAATNSDLSPIDFQDLVKYAKDRKIDIIPKFNFFGGLLSAKRAAHARFEKLIRTNPAEAHKYHLEQNGPLVQTPESSDGLMNHCDDITIKFMRDIITQVHKMYTDAKVKMTGFHVGGDDLTKYLKEFRSCQRFQSTADVMRNSLAELRQHLRTLDAPNNDIWIHANEEVITDPLTGGCLAEVPRQYSAAGHIIHFRKTYVDSLDDFTPEQLRFLRQPQSVPTPENPNATPDPMVQYNGKKLTSASWLLPYQCANRGYKAVLEPENFYALDQAYELDFYEPGRRKKDAMHIISLHRMIMFEPNNLYVNLGITRDGQNVLNYRMCKIADCEPLGIKDNLIGIGATIDTQNIRNSAMLWHMTLPRLLLFAEKAWIKGENEDLVKAEVPETMLNEGLRANSSRLIGFETYLFTNTLAHKEFGRLEHGQYTYRMPKIGARIILGLNAGFLPPYNVEVKSDMPIPDLEFLEKHKPNPTWKNLFTFNPMTTEMMGGYAFTFPVTDQELYIRQRSPEGTRVGPVTYLNGSMDYYLPQTIPTDLRGGACLSIYNGSDTDVSTVTEQQWYKVLENVDVVGQELFDFRNNRSEALIRFINEFNRNNTSNYVFPDLERLDYIKNTNPNSLSATDSKLLDAAFLLDRKIYDDRMQFVQQRYDLWERQYQGCKTGQFSVTLNNPNVRYPPGGPLPHVSLILGPDGQPLGPGGPQMGPGGQQMGPGGQQMVPGGQQMGPGGQQMGPGGQQMGPGGQQMGPGGQQMGPGGQQMGPGSQMGPGRSQMGQDRSQMGQGRSQMGQGGQQQQGGRFQTGQQGGSLQQSGSRQQGGFGRPQQPGFGGSQGGARGAQVRG